MRDLLTISISTVHETRHFSLKFSTLKVVLYATALLGLLLIGLSSASIWLWDHWANSESYFARKVNHIAQEFGTAQRRDQKLIHTYEKVMNQQGQVLMSKDQDHADLMDQLNQTQETSAAWQGAYQTLLNKLDIPELNEPKITDPIAFSSVKLDSDMKAIMQNMIPSGFPVQDFRWSDSFGWRIHPITHRREFHKGQDLAAPVGTPVYAPADGVVAFSGFDKGYGNLLEIDHGFGFSTRYGHLSKLLVSQGQVVTKGTKIATIGDTGLSTGPHLHFEVRFLGEAVNPAPFMHWTRHDFNYVMSREKQIPWGSLAEMLRLRTLMARKQLYQSVVKSVAKSGVPEMSTSTASSMGTSTSIKP
ncbi:MAG TPA: M23 family metallopeptidase [Halothiobacillus sp.]|nr:M23 family metallopeptidase [Halothiobacillus sp.]